MSIRVSSAKYKGQLEKLHLFIYILTHTQKGVLIWRGENNPFERSRVWEITCMREHVYGTRERICCSGIDSSARDSFTTQLRHIGIWRGLYY